jgi:hypothetical protein
MSTAGWWQPQQVAIKIAYIILVYDVLLIVSDGKK